MNSFKVLFKYIAKFKWQFVLRLILNGLSVLLISLPILLIRNLITDVFDNPDDGQALNMLWAYLGGLVIIIGTSSLLTYFSSILNTRIGESLIYTMRNDLYIALQRQSYSYFDENRTGDIMSKLTSDVENTRQFLTNTFVSLVNNIVQLVVTTILMLTLSPILTVSVVPICTAIAVMIYFYRKRIRPLYHTVRVEYGKLNSILQENVTGIRVVRAFAQESGEIKKFSNQNWELLNTNMNLTKAQAFYGPTMDIISNSSMIIIVMVGAWVAFELPGSDLQIGSLISFFIFLQLILGPVRFFGGFMASYQQMMASGDRIVGILNHTSEIREKENAVKMPDSAGSIDFKNVLFKYPNTDRSVLKEVNLNIKPGQKVAILGPTGCGKTTIINLIPRFYDVTEGQLLIDGIDIKDVTIRSLRSQIGMVAQDTFLFNISIKDNLTYGRVKATQEEIEEATKIANIHDFIIGLPDGYDTIVGERGISLSGGQRQRMAIARALLKDPRILIFDDSLSAVDVETEYLIQQALKRVMAGRTTLIITQRLSSIRDADKIVFLENGAVVEQGSHKKLMKMDGYYARLYKTLFKEQEKHLMELEQYTKEKELEQATPEMEEALAASATTSAKKTTKKRSRRRGRKRKTIEQTEEQLESVKKKLEIIKLKEEEKKIKKEEKEAELLKKREAKKKEEVEKWFEKKTESSETEEPEEKPGKATRGRSKAKLKTEERAKDD
ncbi:MAG: ABC transporter ATP-binding protein [Candidatus Hodarchaeota archaeon]